MPADRGHVGMGAQRQGNRDPARADDRNERLGKEYATDAARQERDEAFDPGRQPGAHGTEGPHRNVKPGTRDALEQSETDG